MHASELASQLGQTERAGQALDEAVLLLPEVYDVLAAHRLARRRALNAYRGGQPVQALKHFLEALAAARGAADPAALSISENDLGVTHRHLGNYPAALSHFESSLRLRESRQDTELGALLANIGALYLEIGDLDRAESYLQRALQDHRSSARVLLEHQTLEELAKLAQRRGDTASARAALDQAWQHYLLVAARRDQLRVAVHRAELEFAATQPLQARSWLESARGLAQQLQRQGSLQIEMLSAHMATSAAERSAAYASLAEALLQDSGAPSARVARAHAQLADLAQSLGQLPAAIDHLRESHKREAELAASRHGERFDGLRVRFDLEQLEAEAARSDAELARRRLETAMVAGLALLALAALALYSQARQYRQRLAATAERQALEQRIAESRRAAETLRSDVRSMSWLLEQQPGAALIFDASGRIRNLTRDASALLQQTPEQLQGQRLNELFDAETAHWAQDLVEAAGLAGQVGNEDLGTRWVTIDGRPLPLRCRRLALEEELGVLLLDPPTNAAGAPAPTPVSHACAVPAAAGDEANPMQFRRLLVALMQTSLEAWERTSRKGRIDLAQMSGVWRITIDDGRLRVRAMDRYLSVDTLPERPRWREVLRTAYYLLSEVALEDTQRNQLEQMVDEVLRMTRPAV